MQDLGGRALRDRQRLGALPRQPPAERHGRRPDLPDRGEDPAYQRLGCGASREELAKIDEEIERVKHDLANSPTTPSDISTTSSKPGAGRERRTRIMSFDAIEAVAVVEEAESSSCSPRPDLSGLS